MIGFLIRLSVMERLRSMGTATKGHCTFPYQVNTKPGQPYSVFSMPVWPKVPVWPTIPPAAECTEKGHKCPERDTGETVY